MTDSRSAARASRPSVRRALSLTKQGLLTAVAHKPNLVQASLLVTGDPRPRQRLATGESDLVIEGFGGSANTFITAVLQMHGVDHLSYAHHIHTPSQLLRGAEFGIPTMVVVREPIEAIGSLLRRENIVSVRLAAKQYIDMYETALALNSAVAIFRYEDVTTRIDECFAAFNSHFGPTLPTLDDHPDEASTRGYRPGRNDKNAALFLPTEEAHEQTVRRLGPALVRKLDEIHQKTVAHSLSLSLTSGLDKTA